MTRSNHNKNEATHFKVNKSSSWTTSKMCSPRVFHEHKSKKAPLVTALAFCNGVWSGVLSRKSKCKTEPVTKGSSHCVRVFKWGSQKHKGTWIDHLWGAFLSWWHYPSTRFILRLHKEMHWFFLFLPLCNPFPSFNFLESIQYAFNMLSG